MGDDLVVVAECHDNFEASDVQSLRRNRGDSLLALFPVGSWLGGAPVERLVDRMLG
jgi:hypothetical protein